MEPRIQYATTSDGVSIAYSVSGQGRPLIAMPVPGFSHAELSWQMFSVILQPLAAKYPTVSYDSRGTGLSDRSAVDFSIEAMTRDLEAVVDRNGFDSFVLASWINIKTAAGSREELAGALLPPSRTRDSPSLTTSRTIRCRTSSKSSSRRQVQRSRRSPQRSLPAPQSSSSPTSRTPQPSPSAS